jgi:imidazolonepropionase-like amidohydrolase
MKVAQDSNPQRGSPQFGGSRAGMGWLLEHVNDRARAAVRDDRFDLQLENLKRVHAKELPVLIHTAGSDGAINTARMWRGTYDTRSVLSHGSFDGWKSAAYVAQMGMPVNNGPRTMDWYSSREGRYVGMAHEYHEAGVPLISMNTDAGVMPQEELFLQGSMASRLGADSYLMLRAVTANPALAFGIDDRVGSLEVGKDGDVVVWNGPPLDPRARVEIVLIEGRIEYRARDGQQF